MLFRSTFIGFIIYPLWRGISKNSQELVETRKELILFQGRAGKFEEFKKTYEELKPELEKIGRLFVDPRVPIELIKFWEDAAQDSKLLIDISPFTQKSSEKDPWNSIGFRLTLIGKFPNFLKFLIKTETAPYLIEIQNIVIRKISEEELKKEEYKQFSLGDVKITLSTKVFTK